jgi:hypothetical protein
VSKPRIDCLAAYFGNIVSEMDVIQAEWYSLNFVHWPEACTADTVRFGRLFRRQKMLMAISGPNALVIFKTSINKLVENRFHVVFFDGWLY